MASPGAVCDQFNRRPMHRLNRWSLESLQLCQEANGYFSCCEWPEEPMPLDRKFRCLHRKATNGYKQLVRLGGLYICAPPAI